MKKYRDIHHYYLSNFFKHSELNYDSLWLFYHHEDGIQWDNFFLDYKVYSFLWEYADADILIKIDEWKRAFRRNNIETLKMLNYIPEITYLESEKYIWIAWKPIL